MEMVVNRIEELDNTQLRNVPVSKLIKHLTKIQELVEKRNIFLANGPESPAKEVFVAHRDKNLGGKILKISLMEYLEFSPRPAGASEINDNELLAFIRAGGQLL